MADIAKSATETPALQKRLHRNAERAAEESVIQFTDSILLQAKTLACQDGSDEVQTFHIQKAREIILSLSQTKNRWTDGSIALGGIILGAAIQGIIVEFSTIQGPKAALYFVLGVVGCFLLILGILKR